MTGGKHQHTLSLAHIQRHSPIMQFNQLWSDATAQQVMARLCWMMCGADYHRHRIVNVVPPQAFLFITFRISVR